MHNVYSTTYPNQSPYHAWRAGFREGVKMCLDRGAKPKLNEFEAKVYHRNYDNLCIWHSVGADVENGKWAMLGARYGTYFCLLTDEDYTRVQSFDELMKIWASLNYDEFPEDDYVHYGDVLRNRLSLPIVELDAEQSKFFKSHIAKQHNNKDIMLTEEEYRRNV
jgi:hypothetical protein